MIQSGRAIDIDTISMSRPLRGFYIVVKWLRLKQGFAGWLRMHIVWCDVVMSSQYITTEHLECPLLNNHAYQSFFVVIAIVFKASSVRYRYNISLLSIWYVRVLSRSNTGHCGDMWYKSLERYLSDIDAIPVRYRADRKIYRNGLHLISRCRVVVLRAISVRYRMSTAAMSLWHSKVVSVAMLAWVLTRYDGA